MECNRFAAAAAAQRAGTQIAAQRLRAQRWTTAELDGRRGADKRTQWIAAGSIRPNEWAQTTMNGHCGRPAGSGNKLLTNWPAATRSLYDVLGDARRSLFSRRAKTSMAASDERTDSLRRTRMLSEREKDEDENGADGRRAGRLRAAN